jgi:tetratricopeptide (TPR) repeat protein
MFVVSSVLSRMQLPPLVTQFNNATRAQVLQRELGAIAERQRQTNAVAQARAEFEAAVASSPEDTFLRENYGKFLEAVGDRRGALAEYLKITQLLPHDFHGSLQTGRLLGQLGNLTEAERLLRQAAAQRPALPDAWFELGVVQAASSNYVAALENFERVARLQPRDVSCRTYKARMLWRLNRRAAAIQDYRSLIELDPTRWEARLELAELFASAGEATEAIPEYQAAVRLNPRHPGIRLNLGVMLARQNRLDEAMEQFQTVLALSPTNTLAREHLRKVAAWREQRGR